MRMHNHAHAHNMYMYMCMYMCMYKAQPHDQRSLYQHQSPNVLT